MKKLKMKASKTLTFEEGCNIFGHKVWQVYDCFYSSGSNSQEWGQGADREKLFKEMISKGVKLNFEYFLRTYWDK